MQLAIEREGSIDVIERLAKLQQDFMDREAKVAFAEAMHQFKENLPVILKTKKVEFEARREGGTKTSYSHAELDKVCDVLIPALVKVGITHRWKPEPLPDGRTKVTCYLKHRMGYEEEGATMAAPPDTGGNKNAVQAVSSTVTMLERYTFIATCGIAVKGTDTDGVAPDETGGMAEAEFQKHSEAIAKAENQDALKTFYFAARAAAEKAKDVKSDRAFSEAKNNRLKELKRQA
jgi:hypothetical protein